MKHAFTRSSCIVLCLELGLATSLILLNTHALQAQSSNLGGSLECEMKDSNGASVPAVVVLNGGGTTMRWTDQYGRIGFTDLRAGKYQLAFCAQGFYPELRNVRVKLGKQSIYQPTSEPQAP
jgi:hypothetical protein